MRFPLVRAVVMPARVRMRMRSASNSAKAATILPFTGVDPTKGIHREPYCPVRRDCTSSSGVYSRDTLTAGPAPALISGMMPAATAALMTWWRQ